MLPPPMNKKSDSFLVHVPKSIYTSPDCSSYLAESHRITENMASFAIPDGDLLAKGEQEPLERLENAYYPGEQRGHWRT